MRHNKTLLYLTPLMKYYGPEFVNTINSLSANGWYAKDILYPNNDARLFVTVNIDKTNTNSFNQKLSFLKDKVYFEADYPYDLFDQTMIHVLVMKLPIRFRGAYQHFLNSKYSQMFNDLTIEKFFSYNNQKNTKVKARYYKAYNVLTQNDDFRLEFEKMINSYSVHTEGSPIVLDHEAELDFLINPKEEFLNYECT